ncbi:MAG TPA: DUF3775 domain-containing protein [Mariprofundaceae bacterium]|nr:DUF3775 domain-containing protein [Mariprofundaceae bacterium]
MLNIDLETVCYIIAKAREFQAKEEVVIPEPFPDSPSENWARQVLADHAGDPTLQEASAAINALNDDEMDELVALMWLGRGDYVLEDWSTALADAAVARSDHTPSYLLAHPEVAFYLEEGLAQHGYGCD